MEQSKVGSDGNSGSGGDGEEDASESGKGSLSKRVKKIKALMAQKANRRRVFDLHAAFYDLTIEEMRGAWEMIEEDVEDDHASWRLTSVFFQHWATLDWDAALTKVKGISSEWLQDTAEYALLV